MKDAIIPLDTLNLTALIHHDTRRRKVFWETTCPELGISVRANSEDAEFMEVIKQEMNGISRFHRLNRRLPIRC